MGKHIPERMCISCRNMFPQQELIRVVKDKDSGKISIDINKKLFGRGAYVCKSDDCIKKAEKRRGFERHFKCAVPKDIYDGIKEIT